MEIYQSLGNDLSAIEPPVWAGLFASFLRRRGFQVGILDAEAEDLAPSQVADRVQALRPLVAAVVSYGHQPSASSQNMTAGGAICREIKTISPDQKVLLVGGHVAALPQRTMNEEAVDYVVGGEGPYTLSDLLELLKSNPANPSFEKVRGLWYREEGRVRSNPSAPLVPNLDIEMPGIAWDLLPMDKYRAHNWHCFGDMQRQPYAAIYTTLGCPYHCSFCCIQAPFKDGERANGLKETLNSYRYWSPEFVISEIDKLVHQYGVRNIKFADEMFVLNPKHVETICDLIIARGYDLNIWAYARIDTVRDNMPAKLIKAGFRWLAFGIESANERVQNGVGKRFEQEEIYATIRKVKEAGINIIGNYIFGLPDDDHQSMQETLDLALELNCEFANFYSTMAYPGSKLYDEALKIGQPLPEKWSGYSQHAYDTLPLPTKHLSAAEVLAFRDKAFHIYNSDARYLELIETKFGPETVQHIKDMSKVRLKRQNVPESALAL